MSTTRMRDLPTPLPTARPTTDVPRWTPAVRVQGCSMQPTLRDGQVILVRPTGQRVRVGDIVVFLGRKGERLVKRVAAGPGDLAEMEAGRLYVNHRSCDGLPRSVGARLQTWRVPERHFFVVGDNLRQSEDSRVWPDPFVPAARIIGVAMVGSTSCLARASHRRVDRQREGPGLGIEQAQFPLG